jgi:hypothetical protein
MDSTYTPGASPISLSPMRSSYPMRMPIIRSRSDGARARVLLAKNNYHLSAGVLQFDFDEGHDTGAGIDDVVLYAGIAEV